MQKRNATCAVIGAGDYIGAETRKWAKVIKEAGVGATK